MEVSYDYLKISTKESNFITQISYVYQLMLIFIEISKRFSNMDTLKYVLTCLILLCTFSQVAMVTGSVTTPLHFPLPLPLPPSITL